MLNQFLEYVKRINAIVDVGLLYCNNDYDRERYEELKEISLKVLATIGTKPEDQLRLTFPTPPDYPTAKVDVRGFLLSPDNKILLVKESADGKWSLPGGWADIGYTPKEVIIKEFKEEAGLNVIPIRLLAIFDKRKHPHPPQPFYIYKLVFHCTAHEFHTAKGFDVLDVDYFDLNNLPPLSEDRILASQIRLLTQIQQNNQDAYID